LRQLFFTYGFGLGQIVLDDMMKSVLVKAALWNRAGHYIFVLWFLLMVALCNRADHYILPCSFFLLLLSSSSFFIPRLISAAADWMSTILLHMAWP